MGAPCTRHPSNASPDEILHAYRQGLKAHHSDTGDGDRAALDMVRKAGSILGIT